MLLYLLKNGRTGLRAPSNSCNLRSNVIGITWRSFSGGDVPTTERISIEQAYRKALHATCNFYQNARGHCGAPKRVNGGNESIWNDHPPRLLLQTQRNGRSS